MQKTTIQKKSFRLNRYFSITSLIGIVVVVGVLGYFSHRTATDALVDQQTRANTELTTAYANTVWPNYGSFITSASELDVDELVNRPETSELREAVLRQMGDSNVVKVKIYNLDALTVFSTEVAQIGDDKSTNSGFLAARDGQTVSELTYREQFSAFEMMIEDRNVLSSYIPIREPGSGDVIAVFELYSDVTDLVTATADTSKRVILTVAGSLFTLYFFLLLIVKRADRILRAQEHEQEKNLAALEAANSTIRRANSELEQEVDRRTSKLRLAMEEAQAANKAKSGGGGGAKIKARYRAGRRSAASVNDDPEVGGTPSECRQRRSRLFPNRGRADRSGPRMVWSRCARCASRAAVCQPGKTQRRWFDL